ncbi:MAG: PHP domain-containing protein [Pseudomonadota bacterium]|nr:PHP domain-containing protein [Pseudomonadota bacterium]
MADRLAIAALLDEIAVRLQATGENPFRARAYAKGAAAVRGLDEDTFSARLGAGALERTPGIGGALAAVVTDLAAGRRSDLLETLRTTTPAPALLAFLTPRQAQAVTAAGIGTVERLREAVASGRLATIKGFGPVTARRVGEALAHAEARQRRVLLVDARPDAESLAAWTGGTVAGAVRRWQETVDVLRVVVVGGDAEIARAAAWPPLLGPAVEPRRVRGHLASGLPVEVYVVPPAQYARVLLLATGSDAHVRALGDVPDGPDEAAIYAAMGMAYVPPELREDAGEIEAAQDGTLPTDLVTLADVRGLVHCHSTWSDGRDSIADLARGAEARGMAYLTITDHSPAAHYAGGVTLERMVGQWAEIDAVQRATPVRLLRGTESDILPDGALDYPDDVLARLEVVIASIHTRGKLDRAAMTARVERALRHPVHKIWGHALGRLVDRRDPIDVDVPRLLDAVAQSRATIEINGDPYRLDLPPDWIREARRRGAGRFVISVDAHSVGGFDHLAYGVAMARRGWVRRGEVLNTRDAGEFAAAVRPG